MIEFGHEVLLIKGIKIQSRELGVETFKADTPIESNKRGSLRLKTANVAFLGKDSDDKRRDADME